MEAGTLIEKCSPQRRSSFILILKIDLNQNDKEFLRSILGVFGYYYLLEKRI
jgi:hypothetical protein